MKISVCILAVIGLSSYAVAYSPIIDGALADVRIKVVDDMGDAVPDATISVTFYTSPEKVAVKRGTTDADGCFSAKGLCIGEAHAWIRKDGYYETKKDPTFRALPDKDVARLRKWSEGTVYHQKGPIGVVESGGVAARARTLAATNGAFWCTKFQWQSTRRSAFLVMIASCNRLQPYLTGAKPSSLIKKS